MQIFKMSPQPSQWSWNVSVWFTPMLSCPNWEPLEDGMWSMPFKKWKCNWNSSTYIDTTRHKCSITYSAIASRTTRVRFASEISTFVCSEGLVIITCWRWRKVYQGIGMCWAYWHLLWMYLSWCQQERAIVQTFNVMYFYQQGLGSLVQCWSIALLVCKGF